MASGQKERRLTFAPAIGRILLVLIASFRDWTRLPGVDRFAQELAASKNLCIAYAFDPS